MEPLQAHLDDCTLADFGQESHLGQLLDNLLVGLGSQLGALDMDSGALDMDPEALESQPEALHKDSGVLGSQAGMWGSHSVLKVLGMLLVDTEGHTQLANVFLREEPLFACCAFPWFNPF